MRKNSASRYRRFILPDIRVSGKKNIAIEKSPANLRPFIQTRPSGFPWWTTYPCRVCPKVLNSSLNLPCVHWRIKGWEWYVESKVTKRSYIARGRVVKKNKYILELKNFCQFNALCNYLSFKQFFGNFI